MSFEEVAKRDNVEYRYDILDSEFLYYLAVLASIGAKKYGDLNWTKSRLSGEKSPINHIYKHLNSYQLSKEYEHPELGLQRKFHLIAIAFNAMMEFYYEP